jgi:hypothetical protein
MKPENKFAPRINLACPYEEIFTQNIDGATEYISLEEHEHILREAIAKTWEEIAVHCGHPDPAEACRIILKKAKEAREKPSKGS